MYNHFSLLLHCHALLLLPCISSAIISGANCLCCHLFIDACCESTLQSLSCTAIVAIVFIAISSLMPSIFHHFHPSSTSLPSLHHAMLPTFTHWHALLPSPCISSAIISASCLLCHLFVDTWCKPTLQPLSCTAIIAIVFIAISLLMPSIFHHCHPLLHCHLFIEQCCQPSLIGMYNHC